MATHLVFGAGLIGGYLGAALASAKQSVKLVARASVQQKLLNGIRLTDYLGNETTLDNIDFIGKQDVFVPNYLWLTVKCTGVEQAVSELTPFVGPETVIFCCQNGLGSEQLVKQTFPGNRVRRVMVPFNVTELSPGKLHRGSEGFLTLESEDESEFAELVNQINSPLLPVKRCDDMNALLWAKLQLNLGNSINALANIPVKAMLQQRGYRLVIAAMMRELLAVTEVLKVRLPKVTALPAQWIPRVLSLPTPIFRLVANKMLNIDPNVRTSMWWDIHNGKNTEIDYLNAAVVEHASANGVDTPANKQIIELIKSLEMSDYDDQSRPNYSASTLLDLVKHTNGLATKRN